MNKLGIYFGPQGVSLVEAKLKQALSQVHIPYSAFSVDGLQEEKVPEEIKLITLLKDELADSGIQTKEATLVLSGKDLIVRTFEMPALRQDELRNAVSFEAKKYLPFKLEELFSDCQWNLDKASRSNLVLFLGIKKETLEKYLSILSGAGLKVRKVEYSAFSILRLAKISGIHEKGVIALIDIDLGKNEEANFVVFENGFPLFSRDLAPVGVIEKETAESSDSSAVLKEKGATASFEKLKTEILVSLNYYERKFTRKKINKLFFLANPEYRQDLAEAFNEIGVDIGFIDADRYLGQKDGVFSLAYVKAFSGALPEVSAKVKIDLLSAKEKQAKETDTAIPTVPLSLTLKKCAKMLLISPLIIILTFFYGKYRLIPLEKEFLSLTAMRPKIATVKPEASYQELNSLSTTYNHRINLLANLLKKRFSFTSPLNLLPRFIPDKMWLTRASIKNTIEEGKVEFILEGFIYLQDSSKEIDAVNDFVSRLKEDPYFRKNFKEANILSLDRQQNEFDVMTRFTILCHN